MSSYFLVEAHTDNPYKNLAYEQALIDYMKNYDQVSEGIFFWQSKNAVIIGRNQNAYAECNTEYMLVNGIELVRRMSGGGAVYQDLGNLNYTFISREENGREDCDNLILDALKSIGIRAERSGRNDILVDGYKVSGTAYQQSGDIYLQHGTMVVCVDLGVAEKCLTPSESKLRRRGVKSVKSRIRNLSSFADIGVETAKNAIKEQYHIRKKKGEQINPEVDISVYTHYLQKLQSWEWICRLNSDAKNGRLISGDWGELRYKVVLENDVIKEINYETDDMDLDFWEGFIDTFIGNHFDKNEMGHKLMDQFSTDQHVADERKEMFLKDLACYIHEIEGTDR